MHVKPETIRLERTQNISDKLTVDPEDVQVPINGIRSETGHYQVKPFAVLKY
jgi:hypothetical protein